MRFFLALLVVGCASPEDALLATSSDAAGTDAATDTASGSETPRPIGINFKPRNLESVSFPAAGVEDVTIEKGTCPSTAFFDTDSGRIVDEYHHDTAKPCLDASRFKVFTVDQGSGQPKITVFVFQSLTIKSEVQVLGGAAIALVALDFIQIDGHLDLRTGGLLSGAKGPLTHWVGAPFEGVGSGRAKGSEAAGGAGHCGLGGAGGGPTMPGLLGGGTYGNASIQPLVGGTGSKHIGGGAIELVAGRAVRVSAGGWVNAGGMGGSDRTADTGSGGAILVQAPNVEIAGVLAANGAGGNDGNSVWGENGQSSSVPAQGSYDTGGDGAAGSKIDGSPGITNPVPICCTVGSGGGGAGWIRIDSASASLTGTVSPSIGTKCASQGKL